MESTAQHSIDVDAPAEQVWQLISDLPGMGRFSPENTGGRWTKGDGPAVGAVFRGTNAQGRRRWATRATVTRSEPGESFAFRVTSFGLPVADWAYALSPTPSGCTVTESWENRSGALLRRIGPLATGVHDRGAYAAQSMEHTLQAVKAAAESAVRG